MTSTACVYVGDYALDLDWTVGVVGWRTLYTVHGVGPARHVTLARVVADHPDRRDEALRHHREALTLLWLCTAKLRLELDNAEGLS